MMETMSSCATRSSSWAGGYWEGVSEWRAIGGPKGHTEDRRENRNALYDEGFAQSPSYNRDDAAKWRKSREEALVAGEESTMLSLSLAAPRAGRLGLKVKGFFAERIANRAKKNKQEEEQGVRRA